MCNSTEALGSRVSANGKGERPCNRMASTTCPAWEGRLVVSTIMNINHGINHDNRHLQAGATMMIKNDRRSVYTNADVMSLIAE